MRFVCVRGTAMLCRWDDGGGVGVVVVALVFVSESGSWQQLLLSIFSPLSKLGKHQSWQRRWGVGQKLQRPGLVSHHVKTCTSSPSPFSSPFANLLGTCCYGTTLLSCCCLVSCQCPWHLIRPLGLGSVCFPKILKLINFQAQRELRLPPSLPLKWWILINVSWCSSWWNRFWFSKSERES